MSVVRNGPASAAGALIAVSLPIVWLRLSVFVVIQRTRSRLDKTLENSVPTD